MSGERPRHEGWPKHETHGEINHIAVMALPPRDIDVVLREYLWRRFSVSQIL